MNGLQDFLTPFSHLIFANRDKVIVALALLLALFTVQLLITRWRNERLERDLAAARSAPTSHGGRRYATNTQVEEPPVESGALPPVKGGRTYARNLGTALQKAGMGPQIYSPPSPPGWAPNTNPPQQGIGQPGPGTSPYAPQNTPWAAPTAPPPSPWGFPAGAGRGMPGPAPNQAPYYPPQQVPQQPAQPPTPPPGAPGFYGPPAGPMFGQPAFPPATSGPVPAPNFAPPAPSMAPPPAPAFGGNPPAVEPPAAEPSGGDGGRRGKPKRRRFNFNVLENLEKMVQSRTAEPLPPTGWTPPVAPAAPSAATAPPVASIQPPPAPIVLPALTPAATVLPALTPAAEPMVPVKEPAIEAESLPLQFEPQVEAEAEPEIAVEAEPEKETTATVEQELERVAEAEAAEAEAPVVEPEPAPAPEPEPEPVPEPRRGVRGSMRAMLFGEEAAPKAEVPAAPEPTMSKPEREPEPEPEPVVAEQPGEESAPQVEPVTDAVEPQSWEAWRTARDSEAERQSELATLHADGEPAADFGGTPAVDGGDGPSAGTVVIIEDDATAASYYATLFRGNGYHVEVANDGVSGVDLCTRLQPQLILLDVMMPRQNGILVLQTLRASDETKNTPVVVMSNFSEPTLIKRAIQLGALEYVIKTQVEGPALLTALPRWINHEKAFAAA